MMLYFSWTLALLGALCWGSLAYGEKNSDQWFVELSMKGLKASGNAGVRSIVWGRVTRDKILVNLKEHVFTPENIKALQGEKAQTKSTTDLQALKPVSGIPPPPPRSASPPSPPHPAHLAASFGSEDLERCVQGVKLRDFIFLVESLSDQIHKITIDSRKDHDSCGEKVRASLRHLSLDVRLKAAPKGDQGSQKLAELRVLVEFRSQQVFKESSHLASELVEISSQKEAPIPQESGPQIQADSTPQLLLNGRPLKTDAEGWFVTDVDPRQDCDVEFRVGDKKLVVINVPPYFLRPQEPISLEHKDFTAVVLQEGAATDSVKLKKIDTDDELWRFKKISIPIYLELGLGYTLLDPVPSEDLRDRQTAAGQITTQPMFGEFFATFEGHLSTKPRSRIPWTLLAQGFISRNFESPLPQLSFPVGLGVRLFEAKVTPQEDLTDIPIVIPESVLGPAVKLGVRMKWSRTFSQLLVSVTPLKVGSSPLLIDYNPWVSFGYRWTAATAFIVTSAVHQVRYPTSQGTVHLGVSSLLLGVQHDME